MPIVIRLALLTDQTDVIKGCNYVSFGKKSAFAFKFLTIIILCLRQCKSDSLMTNNIYAEINSHQKQSLLLVCYKVQGKKHKSCNHLLYLDRLPVIFSQTFK